MTEWPEGVRWVFAGILSLLVVASVVVAAKVFTQGRERHRELVLRMISWWWMVAIIAVVFMLGRIAATVFFALLSFLALKEYLSLVPTRRADRAVLFWVYLTIPVQYLWVAQGWYHMFLIFVPVYAFLGIPLVMVLKGETRDFLRAAGTLHWGAMVMVFSLSHLAYLLVLPGQNGAAAADGLGLLLFLVLLTQLNDVSQYVWGRSFGRRKVIPTVSPNKTVEGLLGGVATTMVLAQLLAPVLTPLHWYHAAAVGLVIGFGGFVGDVVVSAVKRDIGVKDSGSLIPGHGGILDRVDSLTFTAPLFFHFMKYFYY